MSDDLEIKSQPSTGYSRSDLETSEEEKRNEERIKRQHLSMVFMMVLGLLVTHFAKGASKKWKKIGLVTAMGAFLLNKVLVKQ
jgi:hypothetical protein